MGERNPLFKKERIRHPSLQGARNNQQAAIVGGRPPEKDSQKKERSLFLRHCKWLYVYFTSDIPLI